MIEHVETSVVIPAGSGGGPGRGRGKRFTPDEIKLALEVYAAVGENAGRAKRVLAKYGFEIHANTLREWSRRYQAEFEQIVFEARRQIDAHVVAQARSIVLEAGELEMKLVDNLRRDAEEGRIRDHAQALKSLTTAKAINIDKVAVYEGRPTQITEHRTVDENLRALRDLGRLVESTAEEVPELEA